jgi:tetratricopeptide (TPR) repeat protein
MSVMKAIDLNSVPYKHRFNGASLLISKAHRLGGLVHPDQKGDAQKLLAALAYYDMSLTLMKAFDPNYSTVVNWKCNVLLSLGQYEDAITWYREILRISDEIDGKAQRNPTAALAHEMIQKYSGRRDEPLAVAGPDTTTFDDPPYCMVAEEFCVLLSEGKFKKAHLYLSPALKELFPIAKLKADWQQMTGKTKAAEISVSLEQHMADWPDRKSEDVGWCYFSVSAAEFSEAVTVVLSRMPDNSDRITQLEFGRP